MRDEIPDDRSIILFDGVCNLCNGFVQFVVPRDPEGQFHFASLQSDVGQALLADHDLPTDELESVVLIDGEDSYVKSAAVVRVLASLGGVYTLFSPFRYLPRPIRDLGYDLVAANRYRLFGKKEQCQLPSQSESAEMRARFLE
ncbi:thiol-disulfide oxidoreductase DCC family protein [Halobacteria archaeon AArc-m2/3/4]|uniref:Thiol-disulfide oxidoreductase DCC family protein n=1 Tax=Natronoglomus mannanivorans TaxID=2979990 RepID=A0AAP2Z229_9EURY|nr:thiol-disulfide oxidoreductase DCC family protein [Halobacteria archaeon AArc-xg1-1]MCU4973861.1 thiol-disulfide oxidoreductase DCC family protein [Halobacteria archaeon AArc-m2/3/4]